MHEPTPNTIRNAHARLRPSPQAENASARRLSGMELTLGSPPASQYLDIFNREMKPRSANWAIWWSDLMMTMFIMFAALYAFQMPVSRAVPSPSEPMPVVVRPRPDDAGSILARIHDQIRDVIQREGLGDSVIARLTPGKSLRVTLAGDAFFISGSATLRPKAWCAGPDSGRLPLHSAGRRATLRHRHKPWAAAQAATFRPGSRSGSSSGKAHCPGPVHPRDSLCRR